MVVGRLGVHERPLVVVHGLAVAVEGGHHAAGGVGHGPGPVVPAPAASASAVRHRHRSTSLSSQAAPAAHPSTIARRASFPGLSRARSYVTRASSNSPRKWWTSPATSPADIGSGPLRARTGA